MRWVLPEGAMPRLAEHVRAGVMEAAFEPWVPALWHWEMANALALWERRQAVGAELADLGWEQIEAWAAMVRTEPGPQAPVRAAYQLARRYRLTVYDASYLELAIRLNVPLATLDRALAAAASRAGVDLL